VGANNNPSKLLVSFKHRVNDWVFAGPRNRYVKLFASLYQLENRFRGLQVC
jgi:hypothetical protein